jgi:hypothetical protein
MKLIRIVFCSIIIFNSCASFHYTDYGKPFDFLKSQKVSFHKSGIPSNNINSFSSAKSLLNEGDSNFKRLKKKPKEKTFGVGDEMKSIEELLTLNNFDKSHSNNNIPYEFPQTPKKEKKNNTIND